MYFLLDFTIGILLKQTDWLTGVLLIPVSFFLFHGCTVTVSARTMNLGFAPHKLISITYTHNKIESQVLVEDSHSGRVSWAISESELGSGLEV